LDEVLNNYFLTTKEKFMKKLFLITGLMFAFVGLVQATEIKNTSATGTTFKFTATLDEPLMTGNKVKIDFGKGGLKAMNCNATTCTLSSNALPIGVSTGTYKIGIYNASNVLQGSTSDGAYVISSTTSNAAVSTTGYTKIANNGSTLSDSAKLGKNPTDWACTKDNNTGLIWEVKTTDGGLRDKDKYYNWNDSFKFATDVNSQGLCGAKDWRLPTKDDLFSIVKSGVANPSIDTAYFPNTKSNWFWSSSPDARSSNGAWIVEFYSNIIMPSNRDYGFVRLVRG
jgi:hypothetical protein